MRVFENKRDSRFCTDLYIGVINTLYSIYGKSRTCAYMYIAYINLQDLSEYYNFCIPGISLVARQTDGSIVWRSAVTETVYLH